MGNKPSMRVSSILVANNDHRSLSESGLESSERLIDIPRNNGLDSSSEFGPKYPAFSQLN